MAFSSLGLADTLVQAVNDRGYTQPTPIQLQAIPAVLTGKDLLAGAQTGTGKTAAFTLPILQLLSTRPAPATRQANSIRALVLTPTRELAAQVQDNVRHYGAHLPLKSMVMFGGVSINPQIEQLVNIDILVATPGRLLDHVSQGTLDLSQLEILVLDEADRMLDMGFIHDIRRILKLLPAKRQNLLFSATFSDEIKALAEGLLDEPVLIEVARRNAAADTVAQSVYLVDRERKRELLMKLIQDNNWYQVLVFTRTKHGANRLAEQLDKAGISAMAIHGNKSQGARTKALGDFRLGKLQVLVATDIAARGIDISELPHVINFELPHVPEDYVHRIGRTGRAGVEGEALSLVCIDEHKLLVGIERLLKRELEKKTVEGFEPDPSIRAEPIPNGRQQNMRPHRPQQQGQRPQGERPQGERTQRERPQGDRPRSNNNGQQQQNRRPQQQRDGAPQGQNRQQRPYGQQQAQPQQQQRRRTGDEQPLTNENRNPFEGVKAARPYRHKRPQQQGQGNGGGGSYWQNNGSSNNNRNRSGSGSGNGNHHHSGSRGNSNSNRHRNDDFGNR
ncbi:MAG: DEAD/DEAH box helicase [Cellvibrionales bacterium]|jgi:ATP-dependent RNA helicase RhlE|nr:DEAD/DEAH box helicase [Cellvibrionales bacterium]